MGSGRLSRLFRGASAGNLWGTARLGRLVAPRREVLWGQGARVGSLVGPRREFDGAGRESRLFSSASPVNFMGQAT